MRKLIIYSLLIVVVFLVSCKKEIKDRGYLYPHDIGDSSFVYVGKVFGNYIYAASDYYEFQDSTVVFSVMVVREDFGYLIKSSKGERYALQLYEDFDTTKINFDKELTDSYYSEFWNNALTKNWSKYYKPKKLKDNRTLYVGLTHSQDHTGYLFYSFPDDIKKHGDNEFLFFVMETQERHEIHVDKKNNSYKGRKTDFFWVPVEEGKIREIKENDIATALIRHFNL